MAAPPPDRNLLYGVLARRMGVISDAALIEALDAWSEGRSKSLGLLLLERRALTPEDHARIEAELRRIGGVASDPGPGSGALGFVVGETIQYHHPAPSPAGVEDDGGPTLADAPDENGPATPPLVPTLAESAPGPGPSRPARIVPADSRFRVTQFHARGGLGQVSRAWDEQLGREVALKEMLPEHAHDEERRARFIQEAEINGLLEHPGIVPVYALGTFPDGRPYYAMRFVEGETLQQALERFHEGAPGRSPAEWTLGLRRLLGHFLDVCDAIDYAHSRGVLHRDVKPANILLGTFGETHIIDWGLAKATGRPEARQSGEAGAPSTVVHTSISDSSPTITGSVFGSPPYMSPEQAAGRIDDLDRTSDVYSLGAALYAVLTGRDPVTGKNAREVLELVRRGAVAPPRSVNPRVPPPLEAICLKAMRLAPEGRYPSARALADDLRRWLADEPVGVHAETITTRALRWARHHKATVTGAAALVLTALVTLSAATVLVGEQRDRARHARDETAAALTQAREARRLAESHVLNGMKLINELVTLGDRQLTGPNVSAERRKQLLQGALHFIRAMREGTPNDPEIQVESSLIARRLAHLYGLVGDYDRAEPLFVEAVATFAQLADRDPRSLRFRNLLAETLLDQAECRENCGHVRTALAPVLRALEVARRDAEEMPQEPTYQRTLARGLYRSSEIRRKVGQDASPDPSLEAAERLKPLADASLDHVLADVQQGNIHALTDQLEWVAARAFLAEGEASRGKPRDAEAHLRQALDRMDELDRRVRGYPFPDVDFFHAWTGLALAQILIDDPSNRAEALRRLDDAIRRLTGLTQENRDFLHFRAALAETLASRAHLHALADRPAAADVDAREAQRLLQDLIQNHPQVPDFTSLLATVEETLGAIARSTGRAEQAREHFRAAIRLQGEALKANPDDPAYQKRQRAHHEALESLGVPESGFRGPHPRESRRASTPVDGPRLRVNSSSDPAGRRTPVRSGLSSDAPDSA